MIPSDIDLLLLSSGTLSIFKGPVVGVASASRSHCQKTFWSGIQEVLANSDELVLSNDFKFECGDEVIHNNSPFNSKYVNILQYERR